MGKTHLLGVRALVLCEMGQELTEKGRGHAWGHAWDWEKMFHSLRRTGFPECKPLADVKVGTGERACQGLMCRLVT